MKCKDIADTPILRFLAQRPTTWHNWIFGDEKDVRQAMPANVPNKLVLAKMRMLIRRGLVEGCGCGCRGDFVISDQGLETLGKMEVHNTLNDENT